METYHFKNLEVMTDSELQLICERMLARESSKYSTFDPNDFEWHIGIEVYNILKTIKDYYNYNSTFSKFIDIDVIIDARYAWRRDITLSHKINVGRVQETDVNSMYPTFSPSYIDTDNIQHRVNSNFGIPDHVLNRNYSMVNDNKERGKRIMIGSRLNNDKATFVRADEIHRGYLNTDVTKTRIAYNKLYKSAMEKSIKNVIFNDPATIVFWHDGTKTVVKAEGEPFDPEKGLAMAICKKMLGTNGSKSNYNEIFKKWIPKKENDNTEQKQPPKKENDNVEILTAKQLARKMALSVDDIQKGCRKGVYPGAKKVNGKWMIPCSRGDRNDD